MKTRKRHYRFTTHEDKNIVRKLRYDAFITCNPFLRY